MDAISRRRGARTDNLRFVVGGRTLRRISALIRSPDVGGNTRADGVISARSTPVRSA
jgi:hypothetical protein